MIIKTYTICLRTGQGMIIVAQRVKVKTDNTLIFYNDRKTVSDQYIHGPEVIGVFQSNEYLYFSQS